MHFSVYSCVIKAGICTCTHSKLFCDYFLVILGMFINFCIRSSN